MLIAYLLLVLAIMDDEVSMNVPPGNRDGLSVYELQRLATMQANSAVLASLETPEERARKEQDAAAAAAATAAAAAATAAAVAPREYERSSTSMRAALRSCDRAHNQSGAHADSGGGC